MNTLDKAPVKTIPDASGRQVPVNCIRASTVLQHEVAEKIRDHFRELAEFTKDKKKQIFEEMQAYRDLLAQEYGLRSGGTRGGMTIRTYDAHTEVKLEERDYYRVTPEITIAQALIGKILDDLTEQASGDLRAIVMRAFDTDKRTGQPNVGSILKLKSMVIDHPQWPEARRALEDSLVVISSKSAVTCHVRPDLDHPREQLVVDFSRV
ncbi:DUF3164 family protein [Asaia sp. HN010]|uniref:DUF3164 family protein n=1 Tax=Asaia sp. HN010 TaxID=3081233 RepID=UPI0030198500